MNSRVRFVVARAWAWRRPLSALALVAALGGAMFAGISVASQVAQNADAQRAITVAGESASARLSADAEASVLFQAVTEGLDSHAEALEISATGSGDVLIRPARGLRAADLPALTEAVRSLPDRVSEAGGPSGQLSGELVRVLDAAADESALRLGPTLVAASVLAFAVILVAAAVTADLVRSRVDDVRVLRGRGASRSRIAMTAGAEAAVVSVMSACLGAGIAQGVGVIWGASPLPSVGVAIIALGIFCGGVAAVATSNIRESASGRLRWAAGVMGAAILLVVTALATWRFAREGTPVTLSSGGVIVDPLVLLGPSLLLAALAILAVIAAAPLAQVVASIAARTRGIFPVVALRLVARRPWHHALPIVSVTFALATMILAGSYAGTVAHLGTTPAALRVGAEVRVNAVATAADADDIIARADAAAVMPVRAFSASLADGPLPVLAARSSELTQVMLDGAGIVDVEEMAAAVDVSDAAAQEVRREVSFSLETQQENFEWGGVGGDEPGALGYLAASGAVIFQHESGEIASTPFSHGEMEMTQSGFERSTAPAKSGHQAAAPGGPGWSFVRIDVELWASFFPAEFTVSDVRVDGEIVDLSTWQVGGGGQGSTAANRAAVTAVSMDIPAQLSSPALPEILPAVITRAAAERMGWELGSEATLSFSAPDVEMGVVIRGIVPVMPGTAQGEGLLLDLGGVQARHLEATANQIWLASDDPAAAAARISGSEDRRDVVIAGEGAALSAQGTAWGFIVAAGGAATLAVIVWLVRGRSMGADRREGAIMAALGLGRSGIRRLRRYEDFFVLTLGVASGLAAGIVAALVAVAPLMRAAFGIIPDAFTVTTVIPWIPVLGVVATVVAVCATLILTRPAGEDLRVVMRGGD